MCAWVCVCPVEVSRERECVCVCVCPKGVYSGVCTPPHLPRPRGIPPGLRGRPPVVNRMADTDLNYQNRTLYNEEFQEVGKNIYACVEVRM